MKEITEFLKSKTTGANWVNLAISIAIAAVVVLILLKLEKKLVMKLLMKQKKVLLTITNQLAQTMLINL